MNYVNRTIIVPLALADGVRAMATAIAGPAAEGMWTVGLSTTGKAPATHFISTGHVGEEFDAVLTDADVLHGAAKQAGVDISLKACQEIVSQAVVMDLADESAQETLARLGLQLVRSEPGAKK